MSKNNNSFDNWIKVRPYFAAFLRLCITVFMIAGVTSSASDGGFMTVNPLLFFTIQSNITIGLISFAFFVIDVIGFIKKKEIEIPRWLYALKFLFTVAITLTFLVYWCMLMPTMVAAGMASYLKSAGNIFCHTLVPIFAIADWVLFGGKYREKKYSFLW